MRNVAKTTTLENKFPLLAVENNCILSKDADITACFEVRLPELFTVASAEYEAIHSAWHKAIKTLTGGQRMVGNGELASRLINRSTGQIILNGIIILSVVLAGMKHPLMPDLLVKDCPQKPNGKKQPVGMLLGAIACPILGEKQRRIPSRVITTTRSGKQRQLTHTQKDKVPMVATICWAMFGNGQLLSSTAMKVLSVTLTLVIPRFILMDNTKY